MGKIHVKNGTPVGNRSLCETCDNAQIIRGYRESEALVICNYSFDQPIRLPFTVRDCTCYRDRNAPDWEQMQKLALDIQPATSAKSAGFRVAVKDDQEVASETEIVTE